MKNQKLLENDHLPGEMEDRIQKSIDDYNHERCDEPLDNLTPADFYDGRRRVVLECRKKIKRGTLARRR